MKTDFKKYGIMIIVAVLVVAMVFAGAASAADVSIKNAEEWKSNISTFQDMESEDTIYLTGDIDFKGATTGVAIATWTDSTSPKIEGNNHVISNFTISGSGDFGLFGKYYGSKIANLTLRNFSVSGSDNVGGLVGNAASEIEIENVRAEFGTVNGSNGKVGGLVGFAGSVINLINCSAENCMIVSSSGGVGGLVGNTEAAVFFDECAVNNCSISGNNNVGGLAGGPDSASSSPFMRACNVTNSIVSAGGNQVGGLVGVTDKATNKGIENCRVENCVVAGNNNVGGLVGNAGGSASNFTAGGNWLNKSAIRGTGSNVASVVGKNVSAKSEYWELYPFVMNTSPIYLHNTSNLMDFPQVIIAKSAVPAEQGPENPDYFNKMGSTTYFGEPTAVNAQIVTRLTGYGYKGQYSALAYVYPTEPEYAITNISYSNGMVTAYNATNPAGAIVQSCEGYLVHLDAVNNSGYRFISWNVTNSTGVSITSITDGNFTMPDESVNVDAIFYANVTTVYFHNESGLIESKLNTYGQAKNFTELPTKPGYSWYWNVSETGANLDSYVTNGNWAYPGDDAGELNVYVNWTVIPTPKKHSESKDLGSTVILTEPVTPTPIPTATPTATAVPTIATVKPTSQQTSKSPAPFIGLIAGLGAAAVLLRLRK